MRLRVGAAVLVSGLVVAAGVVLVLSQRVPRLSGSNSVPANSYVVALKPGQRVCQPREMVPADSAALRLFVGVYGKSGPRLDVSAEAAGRPLTGGGTSGGYPDGLLRIPVRRVRGVHAQTRVCIRNGGSDPVAIAGRPSVPTGTMVSGRPLHAGIYLAWLRPGRESGWALVPTVADRFGIAKAGFMGSWTLWAVLGILVAAWALAVGTVLRWARP